MINGEKWFSSNARYAAFVIVMAVTDPDASAYQGMSMFLVPSRDAGHRDRAQRRHRPGERASTARHGYVRYNDVRVPADHLLGGEGQAFVIAQTRLGGGRIHHAMRTVALCAQGVRHDVRARAVPQDPRRPRSPTSR